MAVLSPGDDTDYASQAGPRNEKRNREGDRRHQYAT
jgi:hypothetical protein